jgi:hypothetical protein
VRYAFVARERTHYPTRILCRLLVVSVSGFYAYLRRPDQPDRDAALRTELRAIHADSRATYGRPRMVWALRACAHKVGPKRVARLMREEGLRGNQGPLHSAYHRQSAWPSGGRKSTGSTVRRR